MSETYLQKVQKIIYGYIDFFLNKANGGKYKQLVNASKGFMGVLCYSNNRDGRVSPKGRDRSG